MGIRAHPRDPKILSQCRVPGGAGGEQGASSPFPVEDCAEVALALCVLPGCAALLRRAGDCGRRAVLRRRATPEEDGLSSSSEEDPTPHSRATATTEPITPTLTQIVRVFG